MKSIDTKKIICSSLLGVASIWSVLEAGEVPRVVTVQPLYGGALSAMSANGKWAVGDAVNPGNSSQKAFPRLVNADSGETVELFSEEEGLQQLPMSATCVSDDGKTVAGSYMGLPAFWREGSGWSALCLPSGIYDGGLVSALTPDGRYAVGRASIDLFHEYPCMWDLQSGELLELPGMIDSNPRYADKIEQGGDPAEWSDDELNVRLTGISPDGNFLLGMVDFAFPEAAWEFIYRRDTGNWTPLGMKYENGRLLPSNDDIMNVDECVFSADGAYIGGTYYSVSDSSVPFLCPTEDPEAFALSPDGEGVGVWAVGSDGILYGATPIATPVRNWSAKVGKYWYDWKSVLRQLYDIDWLDDVTKDDLGLSGTVGSVSADNLRILATDWAQNISYIISLPKPLSELCKSVDLLADYNVFPPEGAEFSMLQSVVLDMGRDVEVCGEKTAVSLLDAEGNRLRASINFSTKADSKRQVEIIFRNFTFEPGKEYSVVVPERSIQIAGDPERSNKEIRISYRGRNAGPVKPVSMSPGDGAEVARINFTTNPVVIRFDAALSAGENPDIKLSQIKDGNEEYLYQLNATVSGSTVMIYPVSEQRLAEGCSYRIDFGEASVSDLSGAGPNEAFSITYKGSYVPEIDPSSATIYYNDFSEGVAGMMLYEGDGNSPSEAMAEWGFKDQNTPWIPVLDDDDTEGNYAAASHSSYDPAGQSNDWMVTPQLYIPDDKATLTFKSQSYKMDKTDILKVFVWESEDVVTVVTPSVAEHMRYDGNLVYSTIQSPGDSEDVLADEWTLNSVDLSKYAGKYIYIAFVNDDRNQSAVFVDDIMVSREVPVVLSIDTESTLVDAEDVVIKGRFVVMKDDGIEGYRLELYDEDINCVDPVDVISSDDHIGKGEVCTFDFAQPLELERGYTKNIQVRLYSGDDFVLLRHSIKDLLFPTTKRVLLEEMTGTTCQFCPQGIIAIDYLDDVYGDRFIPVAIHSYLGDQFGGAEQSAYSSFLGLSAAPTGVVCRGGLSNPMYFDAPDYVFSAPDGRTWLQNAEESLKEMAEADIDIKEVRIDQDSKTVNVDMTVNFAVSHFGANINIFGVLMEDELIGIQTNGLSNIEAPGLGEWGKGGAYGNSSVLWYYDDVVRGTSAVQTAGTYSGFNGKGGYIPSSVEAGQPVDVTFDFALPAVVADVAKTKVCVVLIDANTGAYVNAAVSPAVAGSVEGVASESDVCADVFDLSGRIVMHSASRADVMSLEKGIYIHGGKKIVVR